ncbi:hypothetical protein ACHQM5_027120 [Ranunculus cassubicifolius]
MEDLNPQIFTEIDGLCSNPDLVFDSEYSMVEDGVLNQIEEISRNESRVSDEIDEISFVKQEEEAIKSILMKEHKDLCPIIQKVDFLHTKIKCLKKEQVDLLNEVNAISGEQFCGLEIMNVFGSLRGENETLKKKLVEESVERKQLYNEVINLKGNIRVFCRCRPLNVEEIASGTSSVVDIDSSRDTELQMVISDSSKKQFKFDHVFGPEDNQEAVFAQTSPLVISVLDGFNVCIFAYGQTGTGKTFTMEGTPGNRGVNFRTIEELFRNSKERSTTMKYELSVSMLEVYNEKIRDLLVENSSQPSKKLEIKQAAEGTQEIPGLTESSVSNSNEVWELLKTGSSNRAVGSTNANELSSRSHCLFRVTVRGENRVNGQRTKSHLWLVDLAGSERVGRIEVDGERLKESQFINKSLSALGDVISALASKSAHIPYRNSKLTHLLQSSLGGDCKALMFVQISPSASDLGESLCSLNFASRVRGIENGPARKQADPTENFKFKQMVERLKHEEKETMKLQDSLHSLQLRYAAREQQFKSQKDKIRDLENQLAEERRARLLQEARAAAPVVVPKPPVQAVKKPPLCPPKPREPLRKITNLLPPPIPPRKIDIPVPITKENDSETSPKAQSKNIMRPRRVSIAVHRPTETMQAQPQVHQPRPKRHRASIATLRPDSQLLSTMNNTSTVQNGVMMARRLFPTDRRKSRLFTPLPDLTHLGAGSGQVMTNTGGSKFMGSPPGLKTRPPTAVAVQRRHFVWSPLKLKIQKERKSLPPSRFVLN